MGHFHDGVIYYNNQNPSPSSSTLGCHRSADVYGVNVWHNVSFMLTTT